MSTDSKIRALLSLNQFEYDHLLEVFDPLVNEKLFQVTLNSQLRLFRCYEEPGYRIKQCKRLIGLYRFMHSLGILNWPSWKLALSDKVYWRKSSSVQSIWE